MKSNKTFTFYDNLKTSDNLKQRILNKTINKKETKFKRIPKLAYTISLILLVSFISCSIVFAAIYMSTTTFNKRVDDKGDYHQGIILKDPVEIKDDGTFEISQDTTLADIENDLDIQFADNIDKSSVVSTYDIKKNDDGKIEAVELFIRDYMILGDKYGQKVEPSRIDLYIFFMTPNASEEIKTKFTNLYDYIDAWEEMKITEVKLNKINAIAYVYNPFNSNSTPKLLNYAVFTYDNIAYYYQGITVKQEDMIEAMEYQS